MMCARAIGVGCGCPKACINPSDKFLFTNYRNAVKNAHRPLQMPKVNARPTVEDTASYSDDDGGGGGGSGDGDGDGEIDDGSASVKGNIRGDSSTSRGAGDAGER